MCKPHKANGADRRTAAELRAEREQAEQFAEWWWAALEHDRTCSWPRDDCFTGAGFCDCAECRGEPGRPLVSVGTPGRLTVPLGELALA